MTSAQISMNADDWQQQANQYLLQGNYTQAAYLYEQAIEVEPELKSHYWHLGLMLLLQGQEAEAQMTWMLGMAEGEPKQVEQWTAELVHIVQAEAERQEAFKDYQLAWGIRQHLKEIAPTNVNNLLYCIALSIQLGTFTGEYLTDLEIIELLQAKESKFDFNLLRLALEMILNSAPEYSAVCTFTEACLCYAPEPKVIIDIVIDCSLKIAHSRRDATLAARFIELCLHQEPNNTELLYHLSVFYQDSHQYLKGIDTAKHYYEVAESSVNKIVANHILIRALISASGYWEEFKARLLQQESLLLSLVEENPINLDSGSNNSLVNSSFFFPYLRDEPRINRLIQNQISRLYQDNFEIYAKNVIEKCRYSSLYKPTKVTAKKILKIGYISHFLRIHSVGWLARWLFQHHDRENFQIYAYLVNYSSTDDFTRQWFINNTYRTYRFEMLGVEVLERIREDEIDILIDLDSLTFPSMCEVLSVKPAPIQATWLGWDASGLPSIDYFIADPYVLPESAQDYYTEKIVRLPNTYVAVDGFEVGVPNLRRDQLNIPGDAVIYLVTQNAYKRHLDNVRLQMRIIKEVPNSYLLIKGLGDQESSRTFFEEVAEEVGVSCDRLRFLPRTPSEEVHRANLAIADVILDTYPYNGATTTLETLWMGIPLVTRVGLQFAARNSYAFMMNVGVTEGIAWTDEEYVEWGVRLGKDPALRQQITWKLRQSRQTSPLWNAKQFTREMENAYKQMWQRYVEANS